MQHKTCTLPPKEILEFEPSNIAFFLCSAVLEKVEINLPYLASRVYRMPIKTMHNHELFIIPYTDIYPLLASPLKQNLAT